MCVSVQFNREDGSGFGSWKTVLAVPVPHSVPGPVRFLGHPEKSTLKRLLSLQHCNLQGWPGEVSVMWRASQKARNAEKN